MRSLDSRRLTGANIHTHGPAAILEVAFEPGESVDTAIHGWRLALTAALRALEWPLDIHVRLHDDGRGQRGADLVFTAPVDALYLATEINDWALAHAADPTPDPTDMLPTWRAAARAELRPGILALRTAAAEHHLPVLSDDDTFSIGHGRHSLTWSTRQIGDTEPTAESAPSVGSSLPAAVPWARLARVPIDRKSVV